MKVVILGAGVLGVTTAYFLAERGHEVEVIERNSGAAQETSFANGGQLSYSHAEPWASPATLKKLPKWLLDSSSPLLFKPSADIKMWQWCLKFLLNCHPAKVKKNTFDTLNLALYSKSVLQEIRAKADIDFHFLANGILHIFSDQKSLDAAVVQAKMQYEMLECSYEVMNYKQVIALEPALVNTSRKIIGGIFHKLDESGDVHIFTEKLAGVSANIGSGVTYYYGRSVTEIKQDGNKITAVRAGGDVFKADAFVVCCGSYSRDILAQAGVHLPIYPMKGYSISVPCGNSKFSPHVSVTDQEKKIVYSKLGGVLRVAGTAEFAGYNSTIKKSRTNQIKRSSEELFPLAGDYNNISEWACLRPQTPQGNPYIGKTKISNLYCNTGHGTLGWTLAAGSAKIMADIIDGNKPEIEIFGFQPI